ncbi:hypothetical protein MYCTH_2308413 [Thermothelomyces thermophilus ATCC 42464]|uniref:Uncharacterized protein n=1 Tax=Thermothelomyces thermophilus (strain ATCC 42464 / BCRC 31852 / DSM 1799) TaxID=573729 RepID=G2QJT1_THET4|nr:uncharacterized protein MYCTH_2308413 [Thermothelomyces thermophilus ATCC 42464]AEO59837.1 hypothetical protein MYCTH_2308413 [Thermothelomyces thermophilus ATCC 42464]
MCKIRIIHFSEHDVRIPIATDPFSAPGGKDDFICSNEVARCACNSPIAGILVAPEADESGRRPGSSSSSNNHYARCPWHRCCVTVYQVLLCQWYWNHAEEAALQGDGDGDEDEDVDEEPETWCPNRMVLHEHHPIGMLLSPHSPSGDAAEWDETREPFSPGCFPAGDLLYSDEILDDGDGADAVPPPPPPPPPDGLQSDRYEVQALGRLLRARKETLARAVALASEMVESLAGDLEGVRCLGAADAVAFLARIRSAGRVVDLIEDTELGAAELYRDMVRRVRSVLAALGRVPAPGGTVASHDGTFSISRAQLDLADLDPHEVLEVCDGPLKRSGELRERLAEIATLVARLPRELERRRRRRRRQGSRSGLDQHPAVRRRRCQSV